TLTGDASNDTLSGGSGNDRLVGTNATSKGVNEIDRLLGNLGNDVFVLGTNTTSFYDDGNNTNKGINDYALIVDFNPANDAIELFGSNSYYLATNPINTPVGMGIFIDNDGTSGVSSKDESIAILANSTLSAGAITNSTAGFSFV
ncbi:MAG: beta strand repeat-containing protein, partial [Xenococcaceae cyanobacterium]